MRARIVNLLGVPINAVTMAEALAEVDRAVSSRSRLLVGVVNAAKVVQMADRPSLRYSVLGADLILADGMSVVWACRWLGERLPERVTGIDLMQKILEAGTDRAYRIYFLGATQEVLSATLARVRREHPGVIIAGSHHGYFRSCDEGRVARAIQGSRPDILFVAMSSPRKEQFLARWAERIGVPVCHGVGGAFDVFAGKVRRSPRLWQSLGLEWLYRVAQEPTRLWKRYLVTNVLFVALVLNERWARKLPPAPRVSPT